jgi:hypothetical protein
MTMFEASEQQLSLGLDSSAEGSLARMSRPPARVLACKVLAAAFGSSSSASSASYGLSGSWSRTWRAALRSGWTLSCAGWNSSAMLAYRSRLRLAMSAHRTAGAESLLLPSIRASDADRGGRGDLIAVLRGNPNQHTGGLLPTPNGGGARWPTLTAKANLLSPSMAKWSAHRALRAVILPTLVARDSGTRTGLRQQQGSPSLRELLPTLCSRDAKGIGPEHTRGGQDLPRTLGGNLSANWCRWYMGFPPGWLDVLDESRFACSAIASSRSAPKSSAG